MNLEVSAPPIRTNDKEPSINVLAARLNRSDILPKRKRIEKVSKRIGISLSVW
jgi:hypothetical protein